MSPSAKPLVLFRILTTWYHSRFDCPAENMWDRFVSQLALCQLTNQHRPPPTRAGGACQLGFPSGLPTMCHPSEPQKAAPLLRGSRVGRAVRGHSRRGPRAAAWVQAFRRPGPLWPLLSLPTEVLKAKPVSLSIFRDKEAERQRQDGLSPR